MLLLRTGAKSLTLTLTLTCAQLRKGLGALTLSCQQSALFDTSGDVCSVLAKITDGLHNNGLLERDSATSLQNHSHGVVTKAQHESCGPESSAFCVFQKPLVGFERQGELILNPSYHRVISDCAAEARGIARIAPGAFAPLLNISIKELLLDGNPVGSFAGVLIPEHTRLVMHSWPVLSPEAQLHH